MKTGFIAAACALALDAAAAFSLPIDGGEVSGKALLGCG